MGIIIKSEQENVIAGSLKRLIRLQESIEYGTTGWKQECSAINFEVACIARAVCNHEAVRGNEAVKLKDTSGLYLRGKDDVTLT